VSPIPTLFLVLLVILGGFVAYWADILGRTIGKKRLFFKKLRPKHVAALAVVVGGALTTLGVILAVALLSQDVRTWITQGPEAIRQRDELRGELKDLRNQVSGLDKTIGQKTEGERVATEKFVKATKRLSELTADLQSATLKAKNLQSRSKELTGRISGLQAQAAQRLKELQEAQRDTKGTKANLALARNQFEIAQKDYLGAVSERDRIDKELQGIEKQVKSSRAEVEQLKVDKDKVSKEFATATESYNRIRDAYQQDLADLQKELVTAQNSLREQRDLLENIQNFLRQNRDSSRFSPMIFQIREELARESVEPSRTLSEARKIISDLLLKARGIARSRGARNEQPAAGLFEIRDRTGNPVTVEDQLEQLAVAIATKPEPLVLLARSRVNAFAGEFVSLEVSIFRNPLIYRENQEVANIRIDAREPEDSILKQVQDFLQNKVREQLTKDGMIPIAGQSESFGEVDNRVVLGLVKSLKSADRIVRLFARSKGATRAADTIQLVFDFR
jgi:predicted  nucleic acid-binding Zn-ribbon protein